MRRQDYDPFRHMIGHLFAAGGHPQIFRLLEKKSFLRDQANHFGGFERSGEDVTHFVLPATLEENDWDRFLRYGLIALNLRGLAETLAEDEVLRALAQAGHLDLAEDIAARLSDPARRAAARAVVFAHAKDNDARRQPLRVRIEEDLASLEPPADAAAAARRAEALRTVASCLEADPERWKQWVGQLERWPQQAAAVWRAVAERWFEHGDVTAPELWNLVLPSLGEGGAGDLIEYLPARLAALEVDDPEPICERLNDLAAGDETLLWHSRVALLGQQASKHPGRAFALWQRLADERPPPWSAALVETGRRFFTRLPDGQMDVLVGSVEDPIAGVALQVVALEARPESVDRPETVLETIRCIPSQSAQLHWSLRYLLATSSTGPIAEQRIDTIRRHLVALGYEAPAADLCRFLDLVARLGPAELAEQADNVAWAPSSGPETLRMIAERTTSENVLVHLFAHAERFAAAVTATQAEGFLLRFELLGRVVCRLCLRRQDLHYLEKSLERLLPEEQEELFVTVAEALAKNGRTALAEKVTAGIRSPRRSLLTRLKVLPATIALGPLLDAGSRYATMASVDAVEDERLGLTALRETPDVPQELIARYFNPMRGEEAKTLRLLRLARHVLAFEARAYGELRDHSRIIELVRSALEIDSEPRLAALTPVLAELDAQRSSSAAVVVFQESARRLIALESVPWHLRCRALEHLLSLIGPVFLPAGTAPTRNRQVTAVLDAVARLPASLEPGPVRELAQQEWPHVLPILVATVERLEGAGFSLARSVGPWFGEQDPVKTLCLAGNEERTQHASQLLATQQPSAGLLKALAYLLAARQPMTAMRLIDRLPPGADRDDLCLRLIGYGWPPAPNDGRWMHLLATLVVRHGVDPSDPATEPLLRRLWESDPTQSRRIIGQAAIEALRHGEGSLGEAALRLWLHAHLKPIMGCRHPDGLRASAAARTAIRQALDLSPPADEPAVAEPASERAAGDLTAKGVGAEPSVISATAQQIYHRWNRAVADPRLRSWWQSWNLRDSSFVVGTFAMLLLLLLEESFWPWPILSLAQLRIGPRIATWISWGLLLALPVNGWLLSRFLATRTSHESLLPIWLKTLRFLAASVPLLGLFTVAAWRKVADGRPPWSVARRRAPPRLDLLPRVSSPAFFLSQWRRRINHRLHRLANHGFPMAVLIGFLLCLWWVLWLVSPAELSTDRRQLIRGICWALHLLIFFCLTGFLWPQLRGQRGWKAWFLRCAPFFCLLPMPWTGIGYIAMLETDIIFPTRDPLARTAYYRRTSVRRLRQWRAIQAALRSRWRQKPWWQRWPPALDLEQTVEYSDVERRRLRLYQLKTLLLIVDGAALVWAFSAVVARLPAWESGVDRALQIVFHAAFTLAALGLLAQIPGLVAWLIRARKVMLLLDQHPYGRYLLFTQVAFLAGMTIGWLLVEESGDLFGWLLVKESRDLLTLLFLFAALCGIVSAFSLLPIGASSCRRDMHVTFLWPSLFLALTGMSAAMLLNKGINEVSMQLLRVGVWLTPLWAGLLGVTRAGWLLRPYGWRQLLSDQLPRRVRTSLVFLLLTAVLPLGGLAIPLWIYVHHRLGHGSHHSQR